MPGELWEQTILPARVPDYQPRWLDEWVAGGAGVWVAQGDGLIAFLGRETLRQLPLPAGPDLPALSDEGLRGLEQMRQRGASFVTDLALETGLSPGAARAALWTLARRGLVTNDRFDTARKGEENPVLAPDAISRLPSLRSLHRRAGLIPEGRWSIVPWGRPEPAEHAVAQATLLLHRYGVMAREMALLDPSALPWRVLYEVLSRMELAGRRAARLFRGGPIRRPVRAAGGGPTAARPLPAVHRRGAGRAAAQPGSGQPLRRRRPFDVPLLDGGVRSLLRRPGNWLTLRAGRPMLLVEQQGRRLTALRQRQPRGRGRRGRLPP